MICFQFVKFPREACFKEATTTSGRLFVLFAGVDVFLQCFDISAEGFGACGGDATDGAGHLAAEAFLHLDVARLGQLVNLHAQVTRRGAGLLLEVGEVGLLHTSQ